MNNSTWPSDLEHEDHVTGCEQQPSREQQFFGHLKQRSTSAPPLNYSHKTVVDITAPSALGMFLFGNVQDNNGGVPSTGPSLTAAQEKPGDDMTINVEEINGNDFCNSSFQEVVDPLSTSTRNSYLVQNNEGITASTPMSSNLSRFALSPRLVGRSSSSTSNPSHSFGGDNLNSRFHSDRNNSEDHGMLQVRSQSAAPELAYSSSCSYHNPAGPPPGMHGSVTRSSQSSLLFHLDDQNSSLPSGQRHSASTRVDGHYSNSAVSTPSSPGSAKSPLKLVNEITTGDDTVRPAPKTLQDLIQEVIPKSSSPAVYDYQYDPTPTIPTLSQQQTSDNLLYSSNPSRSNTVKPALLQCYHPPCAENNTDKIKNFQQHATHYDNTSPEQTGMDRLHIESGRFQGMVQNYRIHQFDTDSSKTHVERHLIWSERTCKLAVQSQVYNPSPAQEWHTQVHRSLSPPQQRPLRYDNSAQLYYTNQQHSMSGASSTVVDTSVMTAQVIPSTHAPVYMNPSPFGYRTVVPYHPGAAPQHQHAHILPCHNHHHSITSPHSTHEYISVVPIQTSTPQAQVAPPVYSYWHHADIAAVSASGSLGGISVVNAPVVGTPVVIERAAVDVKSPSGQLQPPMKKSSWVKGCTSNGFVSRNRRGRYSTHSKHCGCNSGDNTAPKRSPVNIGSTANNALLDEFRATKNQEWTMVDIKGHVVEFCQDQNGSRLIQQRLEIGNAVEQEIVMAEVLPSVHVLWNDVFGNYVVQKLLEHGTIQMKANLRNTLSGELVSLSLQIYGCRVVQKAFETLGEDSLPQLLSEFHHNVLSCIHDQNGNHVIQKIIEVISSKAKEARKKGGNKAKAHIFVGHLKFVIEDVLGSVMTLSCHPYGCRVLQRILEHSDGPEKIHALDKISCCLKVLLDDQYGNYVIQHVLQYGRNLDRESVLEIIVESGLLGLAKQKFASNVVEKLLQYGSAQQQNKIVREMLLTVNEKDKGTITPIVVDEGRTSVALLMVRDAYANYVVQTTLDVLSEGEDKRMLLNELKAHSIQLHNFAFAKHIVTKLSLID